ncbi:MAG: YjfB family protein [Clostridium sp.]|uniref:YjfB family protein n=1 Tax=Clostridium sp. TaxID=1506 RepID=UPI0025C6BEFB|nr:YjfB family protein [Clostridium sp.]MCE5220768.1 YjfB family protein [Clostridium sp.]
MDIAVLSMIMSQSRVQQDAGIAVMKMAMDTGKENANQMTEMIKNVALDPNLGNHIDVSV